MCVCGLGGGTRLGKVGPSRWPYCVTGYIIAVAFRLDLNGTPELLSYLLR